MNDLLIFSAFATLQVMYGTHMYRWGRDRGYEEGWTDATTPVSETGGNEER